MNEGKDKLHRNDYCKHANMIVCEKLQINFHSNGVLGGAVALTISFEFCGLNFNRDTQFI